MIGLLPAAGSATRMGGLPKFLLPVGDFDDTLMKRHIDHMLAVTDKIVISTRPENATLLKPYLSGRVYLMVDDTKTMSETVIRMMSLVENDSYLLGMPDTYFLGEQPYAKVAESLHGSVEMTLGIWTIREEQKGQLGQVEVDSDWNVIGSMDKNPVCDFEYSWGVMAFKPSILRHLDITDPHVGYAIPRLITSGSQVVGCHVTGEYVDCGTPNEFRRLLAELPREC